MYGDATPRPSGSSSSPGSDLAIATSSTALVAVLAAPQPVAPRTSATAAASRVVVRGFTGMLLVGEENGGEGSAPGLAGAGAVAAGPAQAAVTRSAAVQAIIARAAGEHVTAGT